MDFVIFLTEITITIHGMMWVSNIKCVHLFSVELDVGCGVRIGGGGWEEVSHMKKNGTLTHLSKIWD